MPDTTAPAGMITTSPKHAFEGSTIRRTRLSYIASPKLPGQVTLLRAPIGFGKTSLLRQWHDEASGKAERAGWLSLTPADRSCEGLVMSLARETTLLRGTTASDACAMITDAFGNSRNAGYVLFIDDWDEIAGSGSERILAELAGSGRCLIRIMIAARRHTALPVEHLLATGRLRLIGQDALRFSDSEQRRLMGAAEWSSLSNDLLAALDGWPLAFKLLRHSDHVVDRDHQTAAAFAHDAGLSAIVGARIAAACSVAEAGLLDLLGMSADVDVALLNGIRGRTDSGQLLDGLTSLLPFQAYTDGGALRYRPAAVLRPMLERRFDSLASEHRQRITDAGFDRSIGFGRTLEAINFALGSGNAHRAIALLETIGPLKLMMIHGVEPLQDILRKLPLPLLATAFRSRLAVPITYAKRGCLVEARAMVEEAVEDLRASLLSPAAKRTALRDAMFARMQIAACSDSGWAIEFERAARGQLSKEPAFAAWSRACSGIVHHQRGRLDAADADFRQSELFCTEIGADYQLLHLKLHRAHVAIARGQVRKAMLALRQVKGEARARYPADLGVQAVAEIARIEASLLGSRSSVDLATLLAALTKLRQGDGWYEPFASGFISMARCLWKDRGLDAVLSGLDEAEAELGSLGITHASSILAAIRAFYLAIGDRADPASKLLATREQAINLPERPEPFWRERHLCAMALSTIEAARGNHALAQAIADTIVDDCRESGRLVALAEACINRARVLLGQTQSRQLALRSLAAGVELAHDLNVPGILYEWRGLLEHVGPSLAPLLTPGAASLLERLALEWSGQVRQDLLSRREISVLKGVAAGLTNKQISRNLAVSADTIKFHLKQCFRKLDAQTRDGAVERAVGARLI